MTLAKTTLEQWAVLAAVVDNGGFAQAAAALNRSQSAVSYSIARLQESLDLPLLVGEGRKSVLTPHGQTLLKRARELLKEMDMLEFLARPQTGMGERAQVGGGCGISARPVDAHRRGVAADLS